MPVKKGKLKPDDEKRIRLNYEKLIQDIDGSDFAVALFSRYIFTADDKEEIDTRPVRAKRTEKMLDLLLNSGSGEAYNIFLEVLEKVYPSVAEIVINTNVAEIVTNTNVAEIVSNHIVQRDYSWLDSFSDTVKNRIITDQDASRLSRCFDANWRHVIMDLGVRHNVIDQERQNYPHSITSCITSLLIKWRQQFYPQATIGRLLIALKSADGNGLCIINWECVNKALNTET